MSWRFCSSNPALLAADAVEGEAGDVPGVAPTLALVAAVVLRRLLDPLLDVVMVTPQPWCG